MFVIYMSHCAFVLGNGTDTYCIFILILLSLLCPHAQNPFTSLKNAPPCFLPFLPSFFLFLIFWITHIKEKCNTYLFVFITISRVSGHIHFSTNISNVSFYARGVLHPTSLFIHSSVDGHGACFHQLIFVNCAAISMAMYLSLCYHKEVCLS